MNNTTLPQESAASLDSPGFMTYAVLLTVIGLTAAVMYGLSAVALAMAQSILRPLRLFLINLLLSGLVSAVNAIFITGTSVTFVVLGPEQPRILYLCRVYLCVFAIGSAARLWSLAAFSLSVLAVVRFGKKTISKHYAAVIITILWVVPLVLSLYFLLPYVYEVQFVDGVACFPDNNNIIIFWAYNILLVIWATFGGLIPMTVSIAVPIVCLCYIRRNMITDDVQYRKGMAKFSLFLVVGSTINTVGQVIPALLTYFAETPGVYLSYGIAAVSFLPTPVIIIAYLKPVREQVKKMFTCGRLQQKQEKGSNVPTRAVDTELTEDRTIDM